MIYLDIKSVLYKILTDNTELCVLLSKKKDQTPSIYIYDKPVSDTKENFITVGYVSEMQGFSSNMRERLDRTIGFYVDFMDKNIYKMIKVMDILLNLFHKAQRVVSGCTIYTYIKGIEDIDREEPSRITKFFELEVKEF